MKKLNSTLFNALSSDELNTVKGGVSGPVRIGSTSTPVGDPTQFDSTGTGRCILDQDEVVTVNFAGYAIAPAYLSYQYGINFVPAIYTKSYIARVETGEC